MTTQSERDAAAASVARRTADHAADIIENLDDLVAGLDHLLACYRTGGTPSGALLDRIGECRRRRQELLASTSTLRADG